MIATHPQVRGATNDALIRAIELAADCAQVCASCADACLAEPNVAELTQCIRFNLDCADLCTSTALVGARRTGSNERVIQRLLATCAEACRLCGDECSRHAQHMEHCRICAETCRECEQACSEAADSITPGVH
ncbi:MAG: four-helix bundle copper-binding protein [Phenylobacterium sp.]|nr:four-helix bundle copper-binding protein [Phenylobacterium sp.]